MKDLSHTFNQLGEDRENYFNAVAPPIIQTSNFVCNTVEDMRTLLLDESKGFLYSRGKNPTIDILSKKLAALDSAEEALEIMGKEKFYVFFLDINLPGMDGMQLCRHIRQVQPFAYISAITGNFSMDQRNQYRDAGFDDYFLKPFKIADIIRATDHGFERLGRWQCSTCQ